MVLAHVNPDADALGSALALGLALSRRGAVVQVGFPEPEGVPRSLSGLPGQHLVVAPDALLADPELVVTVDVNAANRLGSLADKYAGRPLLVIDHHATNVRFGTDHLVDIDAESTTVLIARLLDLLEAPVDRLIAENLYAGLATDSVGFRFASADGHRLAARWLDAGVQPAELIGRISDEHPMAWLPMLSRVLGRAQLRPLEKVALVWTAITLQDGDEVGQEELDSVIDILRTVREAQVAAVLKQTEPAFWQVSLRSAPAVDVAIVAEQLGGGGHVRASGFGWSGTVDEVVAALCSTLVGVSG